MTKALVLSGGGSVGIAWQTGLASGLLHKGVDIAVADFIVGTSAGSAVGAQLALGRDMEAQVNRYHESSDRLESDPTSTGAAGSKMAERMAKFMEIMMRVADREPEERRRAIGKFALEVEALPAEQFVGIFGYLAGEGWPERYSCTAVDAESGAFKVWNVSDGVDLDRAVASSCCVPGLFSPITIKGRRYMDGGMRSGANADLAVGHDVVLIVTLMTAERVPPGDPRLARVVQTAAEEHKVLEDSGSRIEVVGPDAGAAKVMGMNLMDASIAPAAALEGVRQGEEIAERLGAFWS
ncbi:MAG: patatin-like phospholipase family protein [Acidimicrobiales bacterium]